MPYQIRRIIAVNIRSSESGASSNTIAELDPRGGVLALGINGVGKTSFLRLLPMFYGARPQQIMHGSGKASLIAFTLPAPSSAVAYEYEREDEHDLRCAVMFCEAGEDRPFFYIIENGGFREDLFCDEDGNFVNRDEFKARAERLRAKVTPKLELNLYRSVILNERLYTKQGAKVNARDLAAKHSLGPAALTHLDQMAIAMVKEKLSFDDLKNIVIDRVSDSGGEDRPNAKNRELKKSRKDVVKWIEDRDHFAKVMAQQPACVDIQQRIHRIKGAHLKMCSLHLAVKKAFEQVKMESDELNTLEINRKQEFKDQADELERLVNAQKANESAAKTALTVATEVLETANARHTHFVKIDARTLSAHQGQEEAYLQRKAAVELEHKNLLETSGTIQEQSTQRKHTIQSTAGEQLLEISDRKGDAEREKSDRLAHLHDAEQAALGSIISPARQKEIETQRELNISRIGALNVMLTHPVATQESLELLAKANLDLETQRSAHGESLVQMNTTWREVDAAKRMLDRALLEVEKAKIRLGQISMEVAQLEAQMSPPAGSLLEHLRKSNNTSSWSGFAKVIDPKLLERTDLQPFDNADHEGGADVLPVGPLVLDMRNVVQPAWVDLTEVRTLIDKAKKNQSVLKQERENAGAAAIKASKFHEEANHTHLQKEAAESMIKVAKGNAEAAQKRYQTVVATEKDISQQKSKIEQKKLIQANNAFEGESLKITERITEVQQTIRNDFRLQREQLDREAAATAELLASESAGVCSRRDSDLEQVDLDVARQLQGLGIDPKRHADLERVICELGGFLTSIASNRHEVFQWRTFEREVLPGMESLRQTVAANQMAHEQARTSLSKARQAQEELGREAARLMSVIEEKRTRLSQEGGSLTDLLKTALKNFIVDVKADSIQIDWSVPQLQTEVGKCRDDLLEESDQMTRQARRLRDLMAEHDGPVANWIEQREKELPDVSLAMEHEARVIKAQLLCDWFLPGAEARISYITLLHQEMDGFLGVAGNFVRQLTLFDSRIHAFNTELQNALKDTGRFERFRDLSVRVISALNQMNDIGTLRQMEDIFSSKTSRFCTLHGRNTEIPSDEDAALMRKFRDVLPAEGTLRVNLNEQVRLECSLIEGTKRRIISNQEELLAVSSNGNTAIITAMFLLGFVEMIRKKDSCVRVTWVWDEIGRFDSANLRGFLKALDAHKIDVICAAPSPDPALARFFKRFCVFESNGSIESTENNLNIEGGQHVNA